MKDQAEVEELLKEVISWPVWANPDPVVGVDRLEQACAQFGVDIRAAGAAILGTTRGAFDEMVALIEANTREPADGIADAVVVQWVYASLTSYMAGVVHGRELGLSGDGSLDTHD